MVGVGKSLPTIASIQRAVARECGVPAKIMREPARGGAEPNRFEVSRPRQMAMALSVLLTDHSRARIGHFFGGRDPTTVRYAFEQVARRRREDPKLHNTMRRVTLDLIRGVRP